MLKPRSGRIQVYPNTASVQKIAWCDFIFLEFRVNGNYDRQVEAVKKWDWLRAATAKTQEKQRSRRCLSQFFTAS